MILLVMIKNEREEILAGFDCLDHGRGFAERIPGYQIERREEGELTYDREWVVKSQVPDYTELAYGKVRVPISRHSFPDSEDIDIFWRHVPNLDHEEPGLVEGSSRVDAYRIDHRDMAAYIGAREAGFRKLKNLLAVQGYEVDRAMAGSEDGEAVLYRREGEGAWNFLCHLDPLTVQGWEEGQDLGTWLREVMPRETLR